MSFFCIGPFNNLVIFRIKSNSVSCFTKFSVIWLLLISPPLSHIFPLSHYTPVTEAFILAIFFIWNVFPLVLCIGGSFWTFGFYLNSPFSYQTIQNIHDLILIPWHFSHSDTCLIYLLMSVLSHSIISPQRTGTLSVFFRAHTFHLCMSPGIWKVLNKYWMDGQMYTSFQTFKQ